MLNTNQMKRLLLLVREGKTIYETYFSDLKNEELYSLIEHCETLGFISTPMKKIIIRYSREAIIAQPLIVTEKGVAFLEEW
ncbi:MAG: hypothetical protein ABS916_03690 [Carnobacterium sp.]|uniref:hypothetical protein n=1 Tax=Carnobacterium sp. TaxID=48221 RepID=UPI00331648BB